MINLRTSYLGLELKNPIIVGSSGLTNSLEKIKELEANGAGAVVLKSLFEEQIRHEVQKNFTQIDSAYVYPEAEDYIANYSKDHKIGEYLQLIKDCKQEVQIPIIASINCTSAEEWTSFAAQIAESGADALELNIFVLPTDIHREGKDYEELYFDIVEKVKKHTQIPLALKISNYFSGFAHTARKLSWTGISGLVLFNRFFSPDIDLKSMKVVSSNVFSKAEDFSNSLRWVAMLSDVVKCDIAATTGIHNGDAAIKQLLAGANAVQIASVVYKEGPAAIGKMLKDIENWMTEHNFESVEDFRGKLSFKESENPAAYERVQFMKHFAGIE